MTRGAGSVRRRAVAVWLRAAARIVPAERRAAWRQEWQGELYFAFDGPVRRGWRRALDFMVGMVRDALDVRRRGAGPSLPRPPRNPIMRHLMSDIRYGLRQLLRAPLFTVVVVLTLGIGVGATTSIFTVVNSLLLSPLPYPEADRLVILWQGRRAMGIERDWFSPAQFVDIRDGTDVFADLALASGASATLTDLESPLEVGYTRTTSSFIPMFGIHAAVGRVIDDQDDQEGAPLVAMLSHALWQRVFGGDPGIVGRTITLSGTPIEVVGVMAPGVRLDTEVLPTVGGSGGMDVLLSLQMSEQRMQNRGSENYNVLGKLHAGVAVARAQAELDAVAQSIIERYEVNRETGFFISAVPLLDEVVGAVRAPLVALLVAVFVLLAIACANVVNLLLARAEVRHAEVAVRSALGAGRWRLISQLLTENALLAVLGGALGVAIAAGSTLALRRFGGASLPRLEDLGIDGTVAVFALLVVGATTIAFGLVPAWRTSSIHLMDAMRLGSRGASRRHGLWSGFNVSSGLVVAEIGLALVLAIGGGLLLRSFQAIDRVDPGFAIDDVLTFRVQPAGDAYDEDAALVALYDDLETRLRALPGVTAVGAIHLLPFAPGATWGELDVEGRETGPEIITHFRIVTPGYFAAHGIPVLRGRGFDEREREGSPPVAVIDQQVAGRVFAGEDPIGKRIEGWNTEWAEIVGVVGAVKIEALDVEAPFMAYYPYAQTPSSRMFFTVRGPAVDGALARAIERTVRAVSPDILVADITPMRKRVGDSLASRRFTIFVFEAFALVALILAAVGIYGLLAYRVSLGTQELGMRMALGATRRDIMSLVVRRGLVLAAVGLGIGVLAAVAVTRLMQAMLYEVTPTDPATFASVSLFLVAVIVAACLVPAGRAARLDPLECLRTE